MKRFVLAKLWMIFLICAAHAQDVIYIDENEEWCPKEKAVASVFIDKKHPTLTTIRTFDMEGDLIEETNYLLYTKFAYDRIKEGTSTLYYKNGSIKAIIIYKQNKLHLVTAFYPDGKLARTDTYQNGELVQSLLYDKQGEYTHNTEPYEREAEFPGGAEALITLLRSKLKCPKMLQDCCIMGRTLILEFIIDEEGRMTQPKTFKAIDERFTEEVLRVFQEISQAYVWTPAIKHGEKVATKYVIPLLISMYSYS